jgi:Nitrogen regulatory protein P-II
VVEAIAGAANSGKIGDGKIFVYDLERVMRIRTGELDGDALQSRRPSRSLRGSTQDDSRGFRCAPDPVAFPRVLSGFPWASRC